MVKVKVHCIVRIGDLAVVEARERGRDSVMGVWHARRKERVKASSFCSTFSYGRISILRIFSMAFGGKCH